MKCILRIFRTTGTALLSFLILCSAVSKDISNEYIRMYALQERFAAFSHTQVCCFDTEKILWNYIPERSIRDISVIGNEIAVLTDSEMIFLNSDGVIHKRFQLAESYILSASLPAGYCLYSRKKTSALFFNPYDFTDYIFSVGLQEPVQITRFGKNSIAVFYRDSALIVGAGGMIDTIQFDGFTADAVSVSGSNIYIANREILLRISDDKQYPIHSYLFAVRNDTLFSFTGSKASYRELK